MPPFSVLRAEPSQGSVRTVLTTILLLALAGAGAQPASAQATPAPIDVIEVRGRVDAIEAHFMEDSIARAEREGSQLLLIQMDSPGAVAGAGRMAQLAARISSARVPVAVWVGPSGAQAGGAVVGLVEAAAVSGAATNARVGGLNPRQALDQGVVDLVTPTLGDFIVQLDGREAGGRVLSTSRVVERQPQPRREPISEVRFAKLGLIERALHATVVPWVAYSLAVLGLLLLIFEFFSAGIGLAGLTGAGSLVLGGYGLAALHAGWLGIGLVALAILGYAIDVQAGAPRAWTVIATVSFVAGSLVLYPSQSRLGWLALAGGLAGTLVFVLRAMPSMVRARFSTPTIGRESMIGELAEATVRFDPEGAVRLRGGLWRARATRASRISVGTQVRVVALDGLVLEVEPAADGSREESPEESGGIPDAGV